ncbi:hypothetical protein [Kribbella sp. VKM Ac-2568]|uniref:hypothetical protein n=1 Tax=Kribbella sp. VKM Ac-2568 TaxID=2512219 RepID=UPI0010D1FFCA|nr:hypothetical protein [Kribbella sp. VKM Ac-2568]TCM38917.1 hypothetical protein EV648_11534 [Kribbella sp. VKM Ac-2568]
MNSRSRTLGVLGAAVLTAGLLPGTAIGKPSAVSVSSTASAQCGMSLGSVSATGDHQIQGLIATSPPTNQGNHVVVRDLYPDGQARLSAATVQEPVPSGLRTFGYAVLGSALYSTSYDSLQPETVNVHRIGGGWGPFVALTEARYAPYMGSHYRTHEYALRNDGVLFRWTRDGAYIWRNVTSAPGFASVKAMALISKTRTYDTFLVTLKGGALYTVHIPTTAPMKPVVKLVRRSTWQGFESLVAEKCGNQGTLLVGIDKDTKTAHMYAVGHAQGTSTVIRSIGKIPGTFDAPVYFRWATLDHDELFGE